MSSLKLTIRTQDELTKVRCALTAADWCIGVVLKDFREREPKLRSTLERFSEAPKPDHVMPTTNNFKKADLSMIGGILLLAAAVALGVFYLISGFVYPTFSLARSNGIKTARFLERGKQRFRPQRHGFDLLRNPLGLHVIAFRRTRQFAKFLGFVAGKRVINH